jgi:hypothetical protein
LILNSWIQRENISQDNASFIFDSKLGRACFLSSNLSIFTASNHSEVSSIKSDTFNTTFSFVSSSDSVLFAASWKL